MSPLIPPERWHKLEPLIDEALERNGLDRAQFLAGLDASTRRDVEVIVSECVRPSSLFDAPATARFATLILDAGPPPPVLGDRYHIERLLGQGGMAAVYLARDSRHGRYVAVKVLSEDVSAVVTRERFLSEIRIAARLTHPHIVSVHDSGETGGHLYYVMPYVDGESLRARLSRVGALSLHEAVRITCEIADALSYAHAHGVIHRDIKPENVLFESGHAVVADFGIARAIDVAGSERPVRGIATGTPEYMSPEQATGSQLDRRSDLYSLGCVFFEMLAGDPPFVGRDSGSILRQHQTADPPSISSIRPDVPSAVSTALGRALAKRPDDRFNDVALFADAVETRDSGEPNVGNSDVRQRTNPRRLALTVIALTLAIVPATLFLRQKANDAFPAKPASAVDALIARHSQSAPRPTSISGHAEANAAYLRGIFYSTRRTSDDRKRMLAEFERAVRLDPRFAPAHSRLAEAYAAFGYFGYSGGPPAEEAFSRAEASLARALAIDASLPEALLTLARLRWMHAPDLSEAERAIHAAVRADSAMADVRFEHARIHAIRGLADSAIAEANASLRLDPSSSVRHADVAWVYWIVRRYEDAVRLARTALQLDSSSSPAYLALGGGLIGQRKYVEAIGAFERGWQVSKGNRLFLPQLGHAYARAGRLAEARKMLDDLRAAYDAELVGPYYLAQVHIGLGHRDSALHWLEKAVDARSGHVVFLSANTAWDPLRADPRFRAILRSLGLK